MTQSFSAKDPNETVVLTFDAMLALASGETLTNITETTVTLIGGTDPDPSKVIDAPQINQAPVVITMPNGSTVTIATGKGVQVTAPGGLNGSSYLIAIECATSNPDKTLVLKGILPVSSS